MQISVFGIIYILLTLFFCIKKKWFTYWYVFSNTLFYTSVLTIGSIVIKPYHIATLVMFFVFVRGKIFFKSNLATKESRILLIFLVWIYITFLFSFFLPANINVISENENYSDYSHPVIFHATWSSITQTLFPLFSIFSFFVVKAYITKVQDIKDFLRGYFYSFIPLAITVIILFVLLNVMHMPILIQGFFSFIYPTYSRNVDSSDYGAIGDIARTFTYIGESSYTAKYYLIMMCVFTCMLLFRNNTKIQKYFFISSIVLLIFFIALLGSTTGYVGTLILIFVLGYLYFKYRRYITVRVVRSNLNFVTLFVLFSVLIAVPLCIIFYDQIAFFINFLMVENLGKIEGDAGSGTIRLSTNLIAMNIFLKSPFFGVGYGHNRSNSYFTLLLSNVGIIGFFLLNYFMCYLVIMPLAKLKKMRTDLRLHTMIFASMFIISFIINFAFSGDVAIAFGWLWTNAAILVKLNNWKKFEPEEALPQNN
jgi:hypothetical protein